MSGEPSRKRIGGEESQDNPPRKIAFGHSDEKESDENDVVIVVDGHTFPCRKEELSRTSKYFKKMFESSFVEKNKKDINIGGIVTSEGFSLFLDVIRGNGILTDESVELALSLADFLESPVLEDRCVEFLVQESTYSKEEQFVLGDKHSSTKLITRICSEISDSYELHEIVPFDIDSLRSSTKTIVLQKSFELHGHRKPSAPPLPQQPEVEFETMIDEFIDQASIVDFQGTLLAEQVFLLVSHVALETSIGRFFSHYVEFVEEDSRFPILKNQLQRASNQTERNGIRAQIQVIEYKKWHSAVELSLNSQGAGDRMEALTNSFCKSLKQLPYFIDRDKRTENIAIQSHPKGEKTIDVLYRNTTRQFEAEGLPEQDVDDQPAWLKMFTDANTHSLQFFDREPNSVQVPDGLRQIPIDINFGLMEKFVTNIRKLFYNVRPRTNQEQNQLE